MFLTILSDFDHIYIKRKKRVVQISTNKKLEFKLHVEYKEKDKFDIIM
jgi:hypothetical protein